MPCKYQAIPCHSCHNFATTPEFLPQFKKHRGDLLIQIDIGHKAGQQHWVEKNQNLLAPINNIIQALEFNQDHHPAGKAMREYKPADLTLDQYGITKKQEAGNNEHD